MPLVLVFSAFSWSVTLSLLVCFTYSSHPMAICHVSFQASLLVSTEVTHVALKWFLSSMAVAVHFQQRWGREVLPTHTTLMTLPATRTSTHRPLRIYWRP